MLDLHSAQFPNTIINTRKREKQQNITHSQDNDIHVDCGEKVSTEDRQVIFRLRKHCKIKNLRNTL